MFLGGIFDPQKWVVLSQPILSQKRKKSRKKSVPCLSRMGDLLNTQRNVQNFVPRGVPGCPGGVLGGSPGGSKTPLFGPPLGPPYSPGGWNPPGPPQDAPLGRPLNRGLRRAPRPLYSPGGWNPPGPPWISDQSPSPPLGNTMALRIDTQCANLVVGKKAHPPPLGFAPQATRGGSRGSIPKAGTRAEGHRVMHAMQ